ncbi:hypothetical protein CTA2_2057 [Colletotrichum tanaceti]|uniref:Uncharacterized protein n=1 Tax=Colletotrichum tanaceti TaxID=1306861 RepID=A0A4V6DF77_9PEZI|nr:hypothetical protein CTA2_2057 [Colletotrichum tanaceti]TKW48296.1 hypothetical protein CTA1_2257 [Colletotrichum tanaceti]
MAVAGETPADEPAHVPDPGRNPAAVRVTGDETATLDDRPGAAAAGQAEITRPIGAQPFGTKTGEVVLRIEEDGEDVASKPQRDDDGPPRQQPTAGTGTNWLLLLASFLASYSMYTFQEGIPEEDMIPLDHLLKRAIGPLWDPSPAVLALVVVVLAASTSAVLHRQGPSWVTTMGLGGALAHLPVGVWREGWRETALRDVPMRLMIPPLLLQLARAAEAWTGWDITRERSIRKGREERRADESGDCEAFEMRDCGDGGGGGDDGGDGGGLLDEDRRREGYGAC